MKNIKCVGSSLFDKISDLCFVVDDQLKILDINISAMEQFMYKKNEIIDHSFLDIVAVEYHQTINKLLSTPSKQIKNIEFITKFDNSIKFDIEIISNETMQNEFLIICKDSEVIKINSSSLNLFFDNNSHPMAIYSVFDKKFKNFNKKFSELTGYDIDEVMNKTLDELKFFANFQEIKFLINKKKLTTKHFEHIIFDKNNKKLTLILSLINIEINNRNYILFTGTDITEIKKNQIKQSKQLKQQKLLAQISRKLNFIDNFQENINFVLSLLQEHTNASRVYIFENSKDNSMCSNTFEICKDGTKPQIDSLQNIPYTDIPKWKELLINEGIIFSTNISELPSSIYEMLLAQNIKSILVLPLYTSNNIFHGFIGFDDCITNKSWPEEEVDLLYTVSNMISLNYQQNIFLEQIRENEMRLEFAIEGAREGLWDWNIQTDSMYHNKEWEIIFGVSDTKNLTTRSDWLNFIHKDDVKIMQKNLDNHLSGKSEFYESIHRIENKSGEIHWVIEHGKVVERDSDNKPIRAIGTIIDITKQKNIELQLSELIATKDKFFSIIAHDLKSPLSSLLIIIRNLLDGFDSFSAENFKYYLKILNDSSQNTYDLLENLLLWARSQSGTIEYLPKIIEVESLFLNLEKLFLENCNQKNISIYFETDNNLFLYSDYDMIYSIMRNLISNSIKFTHQDGKITVQATEYTDHIEISVSDSGIGMTKKKLEKLFKIDNAISSKGTDGEKGTGLGLILCNEFAQKNNGSLRVKSKLNSGSTFILTIPK